VLTASQWNALFAFKQDTPNTWGRLQTFSASVSISSASSTSGCTIGSNALCSNGDNSMLVYTLSFIDDETAAGTVDLTNPEVTTGISVLVSAGLPTQARTNRILANAAPDP